MHILASFISLMVLALAFAVIAQMVRTNGAQMGAALLGRSPVALDGVTFSSAGAWSTALDSVTFLKLERRNASAAKRPAVRSTPHWKPLPLAA